VVAVCAIPGIASAQIGVFRMVQGGVLELQRAGKFPVPDQTSPLTPTGNPGLPPKYGELPEVPGVDDDDDRVRIIRAGSTSREGEYVHIDGGAEILYRGYHIVADRIDGNVDTHIFDAQGNVQVTGQDSVVVGQRVIVDFNTRHYHAYDAESQLSPTVIQGKVLDDVYVKARESFGYKGETTSHDAHFTTCNLEHPHFGIAAEEMVIRPGKRAIFRKARVRLFGKTILSIPYLSVPLEERTYNYLPVVGQSDEEGYFIKNRYGIPLKGDNNNFDARLDYMTKLGVGYGGDLSYQNRRMAGVTRFYTITGNSNTLTLNNQHQQNLGWGQLTIDSDFQRNNYYWSSDSTSLNTRAVLAVPQRAGVTRLTFQRYGTESSGSSSENRQISIGDQRSIGRDTRTSIDVNWGTSKSSFGLEDAVEHEQIDLRMRGQHELKWASASLDYQRSIPVGDTGEFFGGSDRTPVLTLASDARRLFGDRMNQMLPFRTELSLGEFADPASQGHIGRGSFMFDFQKPDRSTSRMRWDQNGQFRQTMYSDDTAQYVLGYNTALSYRLGRDTSANFRYNYLRPYGCAPMLLDRTGETNLATTDISYRPIRSLLIGAQTGFDMLRLKNQDVAWQQVGIRTEYTPRQNILVRSLATYDTFNQLWSNIRFDTTWKPGETSVSLGARYDGFQGVWGNLNLFVDNVKWGRMRFSTILAYNGYTQRLDAQQYSFIYDLHCAEAVLTIVESNVGYRPGRDIQFFIRLKALPFDSIFGTGSRGAPVGVGTGSDF
jgi:LPS-assembly protein